MTAPDPLVASLVERRQRLGIKQRDLAKALAVSREHLSRVEHGHASPNLSTVLRYADAVGAFVEVVPLDADGSPSSTPETAVAS